MLPWQLDLFIDSVGYPTEARQDSQVAVYGKPLPLPQQRETEMEEEENVCTRVWNTCMMLAANTYCFLKQQTRQQQWRRHWLNSSNGCSHGRLNNYRAADGNGGGYCYCIYAQAALKEEVTLLPQNFIIFFIYSGTKHDTFLLTPSPFI